MAEIRRIPAGERGQLAQLLDARAAGDAAAAYYALRHPADRVTLFGYYTTNSAPSGFLALARTGLDLFRPLAVPFVGHPLGLEGLLRAALEPNRPVVLQLPIEQRPWVEDVVELSEVKMTELMRLDPRAFEAVINVLVVETQTPAGLPRFEIRSGEAVRAAAGVNWLGEHFAEVYLESQDVARSRGFSRSALAAIAGRMLSERRVPLYRLDESDAVAQAEAHWVGFRRTGERSLVAQALLRVPVGV